MKHLKYLNKYFFKYKGYFLLGILFVALSNFFKIKQPEIVRKAFDQIQDSINIIQSASDASAETATLSEFLLRYFFILLGLALISGLFLFLTRQTIVVMSRKIEFDLKNEIYNQYQKLGLSFYKENQTGDLMNRISEDVSQVRMYLGPAVMYSVNTSMLFFFAISNMLLISPKLTLYTLLPLPILAASIYFVSSIMQKRSRIIQEQLSVITSYAQESYSGIRVLKSFVKENSFKKFFSVEAKKYMHDSLNFVKIQALFFPLMLLLVGASVIIMLFVASDLYKTGAISYGNIAEFVIYINMLTWPVTSLGWIASIVQRASASQKRINEFLKQQPEIVNESQDTFALKGNIEFKNASFTYKNTGIEAIKNFNLKINAGEKIAIIGKTGSGKSTLGELILRCYDVNEGEILVENKKITSVNLQNLRSQIGYIPQDIFLFSETILNNVAFGTDDFDVEKIKAATQKSLIRKEIESLPNGFQTMVGERGVTLSGGQKQRISIARALLKDAPLLLFDDCLSAVDANTEKEILDNLAKEWKSKTVIFITHRIFSIMNFDKIVVLENGRIDAVGKHQELIEKNEIYKNLYEKQQTLETATK